MLVNSSSSFPHPSYDPPLARPQHPSYIGLCDSVQVISKLCWHGICTGVVVPAYAEIDLMNCEDSSKRLLEELFSKFLISHEAYGVALRKASSQFDLFHGVDARVKGGQVHKWPKYKPEKYFLSMFAL